MFYNPLFPLPSCRIIDEKVDRKNLSGKNCHGIVSSLKFIMDRVRVNGEDATDAQLHVTRALEDVGGHLSFWWEPTGRKGKKPWLAFIELPSEKAATLVTYIRSNCKARTFFQKLEDGQLSMRLNDFRRTRQSLTPAKLRVGSSTPQVTKMDVIYTFDNDATRDLIFRAYRDFLDNLDWTHFVCLPIAPCFPDFTAAMKQCYRRWNIDEANDKLCDRFHLTVILFAMHNDEDIAALDAIVRESIAEVKWPEDRTLTFPRLNFFGQSPEKVGILYAEPEGALVASLQQMVSVLGEKARDHGFTRMSESDTIHGTWVRPYCCAAQDAKFFNAKPLIESYDPSWLPPIQPSELRLVKRKQWDPDGFYHTERVYSLNPQ